MLVVVVCLMFLVFGVEIERIANMDEEPSEDVWGFAGFAGMGLVCFFVFLVFVCVKCCVFFFCLLDEEEEDMEDIGMFF